VDEPKLLMTATVAVPTRDAAFSFECASSLSGLECSRLMTFFDRFIRSPSPTLKAFWTPSKAHPMEQKFFKAARRSLMCSLRKLGLSLIDQAGRVWVVRTADESSPLQVSEYEASITVLEQAADDSKQFCHANTHADIVRGCAEVLEPLVPGSAKLLKQIEIEMHEDQLLFGKDIRRKHHKLAQHMALGTCKEVIVRLLEASQQSSCATRFRASFISCSLLWAVAQNSAQCHATLSDGTVEQVVLEAYESCYDRYYGMTNNARVEYREWFDSFGTNQLSSPVCACHTEQLFHQLAASEGFFWDQPDFEAQIDALFKPQFRAGDSKDRLPVVAQTASGRILRNLSI